jgi:hypothetical protein
VILLLGIGLGCLVLALGGLVAPLLERIELP